MCSCQGQKLDPPVVYDLDLDPIESTPLEYNAKTKEIIEMAKEEVEKHQKTVVKVKNQLEILANPLLFPCCKKNEPNRTFTKELLYIATNQCGCD